MERSRNTIIRITVYCLLIVFLIAIVNLQISMNELEDTIESQRQQIVYLRMILRNTRYCWKRKRPMRITNAAQGCLAIISVMRLFSITIMRNK